jgi:arsenite methyltransferase
MSALQRLEITPEIINSLKNRYTTQQEQTKEAFGFKWSKRETYESKAMKDRTQRWLFQKYCSGDPQKIDDWIGNGGKIILDAGCGSGYSALLFWKNYLENNDYLGVDISRAVDVARQRFGEAGSKGDFLQCSLMELPFANNSVDIIFSEGVLHHTDNTQRSIKCLSDKIRPGGWFLFYVYAKKAEIREWTDDLIRKKLQPLSDEEAWKALIPLSKLGKTLGELKVELDVPEDIDYLGISKGKIDLQRFFYYKIFKAYYDPALSIEEMNHINFDWYRPSNCHRHTPAEVRAYCVEAGLEIKTMNIEESGIAVVARKI